MKKWKTIQTEYIHKSNFGNIRRDACELPNGLLINEYYVHEYSDWINAVVITKDQKIVVVEQYRHGGGDFFVEVPAGAKEASETDVESIIREVREETGFITLEKPILLGEFMVNPATQNNKVKTFLILEAFKLSEQDLDATEEMTVKLYDFERFEKLLFTKKVNAQLFTATAYLLAKNYLLDNLYREP